MESQKLITTAGIQIQQPVSKVFEAIVDPSQMTNYWISKSSGRMEEGKTLTWSFPEFDMEFPVRVGKVVKDELITFYWDSEDGKELKVEFIFAPYGVDTVIKVTESAMENNEAGIAWLAGNTEGWANFMACLKAWLDHGINLRRGSFNYRFDNMEN